MVYWPDEQVVFVDDLKYGANVLVTMRSWWQGRIYASAAYRKFKNRGVKKVVLSIVQPRCSDGNGDRIRPVELTPYDLFEVDQKVRHAAKLTRDPLVEAKAGSWCKYCPARFECVEREAFALSVVSEDLTVVSEPSKLPPVEGFSEAALGERVRLLPRLKSWVKDVEEARDHYRDKGVVLPGTKAVAGRGAREWSVPLDTPSQRFERGRDVRRKARRAA